MGGLAKKVMIYSLAGMLQIGFGASVTEASPGDHEHSYGYRAHDRSREHEPQQDRGWLKREREYDERVRKEIERYRQAIKGVRREARATGRSVNGNVITANCMISGNGANTNTSGHMTNGCVKKTNATSVKCGGAARKAGANGTNGKDVNKTVMSVNCAISGSSGNGNASGSGSVTACCVKKMTAMSVKCGGVSMRAKENGMTGRNAKANVTNANCGISRPY